MNDLIHFVGHCDLYFMVSLVYVNLLCNCERQATIRHAPLSSDKSCLNVDSCDTPMQACNAMRFWLFHLLKKDRENLLKFIVLSNFHLFQKE